MKKLKRERDKIILNRKIPLRPTPQQLYNSNIAPLGVYDTQTLQNAMSLKKKKREKSIFALNQLFQKRPKMNDLVKRRIIDPATQTMVFGLYLYALYSPYFFFFLNHSFFLKIIYFFLDFECIFIVCLIFGEKEMKFWGKKV